MAMKIIRVLFVIACIIMGVIWARYVSGEIGMKATSSFFGWALAGGAIGCVVSVLVLFALTFITQDVFEKISPALLAIGMALLAGWALGRYIFDVLWPGADYNFKIFFMVTLVLLFGYMGIYLGLTRASNWESLMRAVHKRQFQFGGNPKIVDTSVIIDGRILDICDTGFIDGTLIIPRFVLGELQNIADSPDVLRRAKGRRGLDILKNMQQKVDKVHVIVVEDDFPGIREVDAKLLKLAAQYEAKIITNDYNLNKVAQIEGVNVLNINDLANALKPAVLPDEHMEVRIIKEGKEAFQGVGYLDDGTMVVVDGGKDHVGKNVSVVVTSVLQTAAGRMIFGKLSGIIA